MMKQVSVNESGFTKVTVLQLAGCRIPYAHCADGIVAVRFERMLFGQDVFAVGQKTQSPIAFWNLPAGARRRRPYPPSPEPADRPGDYDHPTQESSQFRRALHAAISWLVASAHFKRRLPSREHDRPN